LEARGRKPTGGDGKTTTPVIQVWLAARENPNYQGNYFSWCHPYPKLMALLDQYAYPLLFTCKRYILQFQELGHCHTKQATGNHEAIKGVGGQGLVNLALFQSAYPLASGSH
jgi:hypothetical protein